MFVEMRIKQAVELLKGCLIFDLKLYFFLFKDDVDIDFFRIRVFYESIEVFAATFEKSSMQTMRWPEGAFEMPYIAIGVYGSHCCVDYIDYSTKELIIEIKF